MAARPLIRGSDVTAKKLATGTFPTFFKIKVFRFIDKLDVYDRRHFLKAERSSRTAKRSLRHYIITTDQSGVFPKIASQLDYELKLDLKRLSWEEAHVWGMCFIVSCSEPSSLSLLSETISLSPALLFLSRQEPTDYTTE